MIRSDWKRILAYLTLYITWGSTLFALKIAIRHFSPAAVSGLRFLVAAPFMFLVCWLRPGAKAARKELVSAALLGSVLLTLGVALLGYVEKTVASSVCALVVACSPLIFAALNSSSGGPALTRAQLLGGAIALGGVAGLFFSGAFGASGHFDTKGFALLILAILSFTSTSVLSRRLALPVDTRLSSGVQMLAAGALLMVFGWLRGEYRPAELLQVSRSAARAILYLATVGSCLGYTAFSWLMRHEPVNRVSSYAFVNPVIAVILGVGFGGEPFTPSMGAAMAAVIVGVAISLFGGRVRPARNARPARPDAVAALPATGTR